MISPLRSFNTQSITNLLENDVSMQYCNLMPQKRKRNRENTYFLGLYSPDSKIISIHHYIKEYYPFQWKREEDITILHEWLHAYEDLNLTRNYSEGQIEWWAQWHYKDNPDLVLYIRSFFTEEGF